MENFIVDEPFASDVSEGKNNPIYNAHSYHTKVPHPAIMRYILHYTQPGDIVFDGFAGTGMTGVAAQMCGNPDLETKTRIEKEWEDQGRGKPVWGPRKAIVGDLSPIASFIAYNYNTPVDVAKFKSEAERILKEVEDELGWMYYTLLEGQEHKQETIDRVIKELPRCKTPLEAKKLLMGSGLLFGAVNYTVWSEVMICPDCMSEFIFYNTAVDELTGEIKDEFNCPHCMSLRTKRSSSRVWTTEHELDTNELIKKIKLVPVLIDYSFRRSTYRRKLEPFDKALIQLVDNLLIPYWFPTENIPKGDKTSEPIRLGINRIHHFYTKKNLFVISRFFNSRLTPQLQLLQNSQLVNISKLNRHRPNVSFPYNPLNGTLYLASQISEANVIVAYRNKVTKLVKAFSLIQDRQIIETQSATSISNLSENSIDYIFTDPPFGANLMYSELNLIWEGWLKLKTNSSKEAIQSKCQNKDTLDYQKLMLESFCEYYRVLKPGKWMTVEFSNTSAGVWNGIQTAIQQAGFVIGNVSTLDKQQGAFNAVNHAISVKQDLVISCYKPILSFKGIIQISDMGKHIWDFIENHLAYLPVHILKNKKTTAVIERSPKILYDRLLSFYITRGFQVPIDALEFQRGLKVKFIERDGQYFTAEQAVEYDQKKAMTQEFEPLPIIVTNEREGIEWLRAELQTPQKHQDIQPKWLQAVHAVRKGDVIPELQDILQQNFIELPDGKWRVPDMNEAKDRELIRNKALVKEFNSYIDEIIARKGKRLKEVRLEALLAGFKSCWEKKDFQTIVTVAEKIPQNLLLEDGDLLMFYDIAKDRV